MTTMTNVKYIEWSDTQDLHADTRSRISDVLFLKEELTFLQELLDDHRVFLLFSNLTHETVKLRQQLSELAQQSKPLLDQLTRHDRRLELLLDDIDLPDETKAYKKLHRQLMMDVLVFFSQVKQTKAAVFSLLSREMKKSNRSALP